MAWPASFDVEKTYTARTKSSGQTACSLIRSRFRDLARFLRPRTNQSTRLVNAPLSGESWDHVGHAADVNSAARRENNEPSWPRAGLEQLNLSSRGPRLNSPRHYSGAPMHAGQLVHASSTRAHTEPDRRRAPFRPHLRGGGARVPRERPAHEPRPSKRLRGRRATDGGLIRANAPRAVDRQSDSRNVRRGTDGDLTPNTLLPCTRSVASPGITSRYQTHR